MEDYTIIIKELILEYYSPQFSGGDKYFYSTGKILSMCQGIIPQHPITEHDIYDVMKELGFRIELRVITEEVIVSPGNRKKGIPPKIEEQEVSREFLWVLYEKYTPEGVLTENIG